MCHRRDEPVAVFSRAVRLRRSLRDETCPMGSAVEFNEDDRYHGGCGLVIGVLRCQWLTRSDSSRVLTANAARRVRERQKPARCLNT